MPWTALEMPDLGGRLAVVTGANAGIGFQIARELARRGARVVLACRDTMRGDPAADSLRHELRHAAVEVARLDLADLSSVHAFARWHGEYRGPLDLLVNNAGVMAVPHRRTADGFELQFGTNHLGHFALTGLLLPALLERPGARVVTLSSAAHQFGRLDFGDLQRERRYGRWKAYGQSKLANLLFAFELARRAALADLDLTSVAAHPGYVSTGLHTAGARMDGRRLTQRLAGLAPRLLGQPAARGALPALYAATMPGVFGGEYLGPDGIGGARGYPIRVSTSSAARDPDLARRLWGASEQLTGVAYERLGAPPA